MDAAEAVRTACEEIGFFVMTGHGFPESLMTRIHDVSRTFFRRRDDGHDA